MMDRKPLKRGRVAELRRCRFEFPQHPGERPSGEAELRQRRAFDRLLRGPAARLDSGVAQFCKGRPKTWFDPSLSRNGEAHQPPAVSLLDGEAEPVKAAHAQRRE